MNRFELESFAKSFLLFFLSLSVLVTLIYYLNYVKDKSTLDKQIYSKMRLCSLDLKCDEFKIDFEKIDTQPLYTLLDDEGSLYSYFSISKSEEYLLKFSYEQSKYEQDVKSIELILIKEYLLILVVLALLSALFSLYALYPLRSALRLTKEFVRDILHDVNTPISSLRLNANMLKKEFGENSKIGRIEQSIENILSLEQNLRSYLDEHAVSQESFELSSLLKERIDTIERMYPQITYNRDLQSLEINTNRYSVERIADNLLTNASKYNRKNGEVTITIKGSTLRVSDTGEGIKDVQKIFKRFYTENAKGAGIGLHIVKKLCDALHIGIEIESEIGKGSVFSLDLQMLTKR